jgi:hypothetical protein
MIDYPTEHLGRDVDDGTMPGNVGELRDSVVGRRIVRVEKESVPGRYYGVATGITITLDNGRKVHLADTSDCCAYTELESFLLHADRIDHIITGVGTTNGYTTWHVYADMGDVLELSVGWSCGNPFWYGYGFHIAVEERGSKIRTRSWVLFSTGKRR